MVIRKITIRNITSFQGEHTIDFTAEPLRSAGLFAITGDTGAGKSTVLDAVCLALYNRAPRFDDREQLKYITGQKPDTDIELCGNDTRNALRRGETDGMCSVEFAAGQGVYRATWRLRVKKTGRYARPEQTLEQLSPEHRAADTQNFAAEVKRIVGLDYEQFTRTVILAQNSFANFLRARQNDKSALLEKITGTGIYALISKEVYRLSQEAQRDFELKLSEIKGISASCLDEADLARAENERRLHEASVRAAEKELENLKKQLDWCDGYARLSDELAEAVRNFEEANRRFAGMRDRRERLERYDEIAPVKDKYLLLKDAESLRAAARAEAAVLRERERAQEKVRAAAAAESEEAEAAFRKADTQFEQQRPMFKKGHDLKRDIQYDESSANERSDKARAADAQAAARKKELAARQGELDGIGKQEKLCENELRELAAHQKMLEQAAAVIEKAKRYSAVRAKGARLNAGRQSLQLSLERLRREFSEVDTQYSLLSQKRKSLAEQRGVCRVRNAESDGGMLQKEYDTAFAMQEKLRGARKLWKSISDGYSGLEELDELRRRTAAEISRLESEISAKEQQAARLRKVYDYRLKEYTLSQSKDIRGLRQGLREGMPCPVCGATHHPYHTETEQHLGELMTMIEKDFREAEEQLDKETGMLGSLRQQLTAGGERLCSIDAQTAKTRAQLAADTAEWAEYAGLDQSFADCSPNVNRQTRHTVLAQLADNASRTVNSAKARLDEYNKNRGTAERLTAEIEALAEQAAGLQRRRSDLLHDIGQTESGIDKAAEEAKENDAAENELYSDLENLVTISGWRTLISDNADDFTGRVLSMESRRRRNAERLQKLRGERAEAEHDLNSLNAMLDELETASQKLKGEADALRASADGKREAIAAMFGGEDPDDMERKTEAALKAARADMERKNALSQESLDALRDIRQKRESAEAEAAKQEKRAAALRDDIDRWIFSFNSSSVSVSFSTLESVFSDTCDWNVLRETVERVRTDLILAEDRKNAAQGRLNSLLALPHRPGNGAKGRGDVEEAVARMSARKEEAGRRLEEVRSRLRAHEESAAEIARLQPGLRSLEQKRSDWAALNSLIGSADGNLFRVQAQCFTLRLLVEHANVQLANLSPRYRLRCIPDSLGLEITDCYMCDQIRPVSSLSGGETFVVSLGLALGLASLSGGSLAIGSLFIDEGFGNLDDENLSMVIKALGSLQGVQGRKVGIISHTSQIRDSIYPQLQVVRQKPGGHSSLRIASF